MKIFVIPLLGLLLLPLPSVLAKSKIVRDSITSQGQKRTFDLFVPEDIKPSNPAPLIVMLHGYKRDGMSLVEKWQDLAAKEGIILVGPNALSSGWVMPDDGPQFLHDLIEALKAKYPINPRRVYLFGHSAGARFTIYMSLLESEYFAAGTLYAGAMDEDGKALISFAKRKIPLAIYAGTIDPLFPLPVVRATRDTLNAQGFGVQLTELSGYDHNYYAHAPEINHRAWEFLRQQELPAAPRYEQYR